MITRIFILSITTIIFSFQSIAQDVITLNNPSFEDFPRAGKEPLGWFDCGATRFPNETPPDVHPNPNTTEAYFDVNKKGIEGKTYMGMVTRENDSWESVSQRLSSQLQPDNCYAFSISLCRSTVYNSFVKVRNSVSGVSQEPRSFTTPIILRIWGGNGYCEKAELLGESPLVDNASWEEFSFKFEPQKSHKYIILEAFYKTPTLFPYNGNILLDNASDILLMPCRKEPERILAEHKEKKEKAIAKAEPPAERVNQSPKASEETTPKPKPNPQPKPPHRDDPSNAAHSHSNPQTADVTPTPQPKTEPNVKVEPQPQAPPPKTEKKEKILTDLDKTKLTKGSIVRIDKLYFAADSYEIQEENYPILDEIYDFLVDNPKLIIEIGGHTNSRLVKTAIPLSTNRAKAVRDYLVSKGISSARLEYKGYGKDKPIASNATTEGRKKNQRVEIKILSTNG